MNNFSNHLEESILNHFLRARAYRKPASFWAALFTANPGENGDTANEATGGSYARLEVPNNKVNWPQCSSSGVPTKVNGESWLFPTATASWGTVSHWGLYDAPPGVTFAATTTNASATIAVADTSDLRVGMSITGTGIPVGSVIDSIITNTSITIINNDPGLADTCTASGTITATVVPKFIAYGALDRKIFVKSGKSPKIPAGAISITLPQSPNGGFTRYSQSKTLDHVFGHLTYTAPTTVYSGFGTSWTDSSTGAHDILEEWGDSGYVRKATTFSAPSSGSCSNSADLLYTGVDGVADGAATITSVGIWDDDNAGNLLFAGNARKSFTVADTNLVKNLTGQLIVALQ